LSHDYTVAVCTRERSPQVARALDALRGGSVADFPVLVVDQSARPDPGLVRRSDEDPLLRVVRDPGRGLSRARNVALRSVDSEWVVFVDDDCLPEPDWAERLGEALAAHPEAALVAGDVSASGTPEGDYVAASALRVHRERVRSGRFAHPGLLAFGVCFAVRRPVAERLGGWDERLGPGAPDFPAADDMDFNYRLLRAGEVAYQTPLVRARHDQWRSPEELPALYRDYLAAWSGFAVKHLRQGDVRGGLWLWSIGLVDAFDMLASALSRRSATRLRIALAKLRGLAEGTLRGFTRRW
jgi:mycofactocin glycosyltransferase